MTDEVVIIKIVQKVVEGREGVDIQFEVEEIDTGTLLDLGAYFTSLARGQRIRTKVSDDDLKVDGDKKQRVHKPSPKR